MSSKLSNVINLTKLEDEEFIKILDETDDYFSKYIKNNKINKKYIDPEEIVGFKNKYNNLYLNAKDYQKGIINLFKYNVRSKSKIFIDRYDSIENECKIVNDEFIESNSKTVYNLIQPVEGRMLDNQQIKAIACEAKNHLIIAGAGTGKTTTIVGYIKYLLNSKKARPEDILVLSFTNASASEMSERIEKETGNKLDASTFHKLGLNIITEVEGKKPSIYSSNLNLFIKDELNKLCEDHNYLSKLCKYLIYYSMSDKSDLEFESYDEYQNYLKRNPPTSLKGETLKSYGELMIANFLYINGINYKYEAQYKFETSDKQFTQYKPDFYLTDYDIYIEYYGIDRNGNVAKTIKGRDGKSGSEVYNESINWKRKIHAKYKTKCIELFAYEHFENILEDRLNEHLNKFNVKYNSIPVNEIWNNSSNHNMERMIDLFCTIINLIKSNNCSFDDLYERNNSKYIKRPIKLDLIVELILPIFNSYQKMLASNKQIDFNDMINISTKYVEENKYVHNYNYVIVDEYQDISQSRYKLLYALRQQKHYSLFCVGDDWQSIYRFSGSDIGFILNFEKYWGATAIDRIETTYRFSNSLIEVSGEFIMQNPNQIKKELKSNSNSNSFALEEICGYNEKTAISFIEKKLKELPKNSIVLFLGRYTFDIKMLDKNLNFSYQYSVKDSAIIVKYNNRCDLNIKFMTAHGSKGLQADYVFILNNKDRDTGFPSDVSDAPILQLLLDNSDNYPYSEERRLYYVALTRAKEKVYLLTIKDNISTFAQEIKDVYGEQMKMAQYTCPECGGRLILKKGKYGQFFGCSNYSTKGCKYIRKI